MIVNGKTSILVNGKSTRVNGRTFNRALKRGTLEVRSAEGRVLTPSKGLAWSNVASIVRAGKSVQAKATGDFYHSCYGDW